MFSDDVFIRLTAENVSYILHEFYKGCANMKQMVIFCIQHLLQAGISAWVRMPTRGFHFRIRISQRNNQPKYVFEFQECILGLWVQSVLGAKNNSSVEKSLIFG